MNKVPLSVLVPIRNEAGNLHRCLNSISWADEIIVVDSQSTDGSQEIARSLGAEVVQFNFNGVWPKKRNWSLDNLPFRHPWVFIFDADEELNPDARDEFAAIVSRTGNGPVGYWINRRFYFMGKWLRHAYYPNWNLRLFLHPTCRYEKLTSAATNSGDNEVHEPMVVKGETGRLKTEMNHYAFPTVDVFMEKHNRYSNWEAHVAMEQILHTTTSSLQHADSGLRHRLKTLFHRLPFRPLLRFLYVYFWQRGFLDGREGYYFARLHGVYEFLSVAKTYELKKQHGSARTE